MKRAHVLLGFVAVATVWSATATTTASADVGPRPRCASGTHSQYLYGNHCVADGSHLEAVDGGGTVVVADAPLPVTSGASSATSPTNTANTTDTTSRTTNTSDGTKKRGCAVAVGIGAGSAPTTDGGALSLYAALAGLAGALVLLLARARRTARRSA